MPTSNKPSSTSKQEKPSSGSPNTQPVEKSYEVNPQSKQDIEEVIQSVPLKDYSDYEIEIEETSHYEDALYSTDEELTEALNSPEPKAAVKSTPKEAEEQSEQNITKKTPHAFSNIEDFHKY